MSDNSEQPIFGLDPRYEIKEDWEHYCVYNMSEHSLEILRLQRWFPTRINRRAIHAKWMSKITPKEL